MYNGIKPVHQRVVRVGCVVVLMAFGWSLVLASPATVSAHPGALSDNYPLTTQATGVSSGYTSVRIGMEVSQAASNARCINGSAAGYPCENVDLLAFMPLTEIGGTDSHSTANDVWGWTDPQTGRELALIGRAFGTSFIDISDPTSPVYLGELPAHGASHSFWRDIKVYASHAFIVSEASSHGMQVFDLTQLREVVSPPVTLKETAFYGEVDRAHNIAINEDTGFAYIVGARGKNSCGGGLHMVDIRNPTRPAFAGCFDAAGHTHDAQCILYRGPDPDHQGREICVNSNEDHLAIVDVTDKTQPVRVSQTHYPGSGYTHQGWLTEDQRFFLMNDEEDELDFGHNTRTHIWDVSDLDSPLWIGFFDNSTAAIDHNLYIRGGYVYQANYRAGLRVLDISQVADGILREVAFFDIYPPDDAAVLGGAWSNYPYFASGVVIVSGIEQGLFILRPNLQGVSENSPPCTVITNPTEANSAPLPLCRLEHSYCGAVGPVSVRVTMAAGRNTGQEPGAPCLTPFPAGYVPN